MAKLKTERNSFLKKASVHAKTLYEIRRAELKFQISINKYKIQDELITSIEFFKFSASFVSRTNDSGRRNNQLADEHAAQAMKCHNDAKIKQQETDALETKMNRKTI